VCAAYDEQTQRTLLLDLDVCGCCSRAATRSCGCGLAAAFAALLDATELFSVGEDEVHVLVEGEHLAGELAAVV
jgi:hypothetical protein